MPNDKLTPTEVAMLFALMAEAREISNGDLKERYGFTLDGASRRKVNDLKFVESSKRGRSFAHQLTDAGWARCREELSAPRPDKANTVVGALYALFAGLRRYLERSDLSLADVFRPEDDQPPVVKPHVAELAGAGRPRGGDPDRLPYARRTPRGMVSLADLRPLLGGATRADVDTALIRLGGRVGVTLVPEDNQKTLTDADRAAAVRVGGRDHHYLSIEDA